MPEPKTDRSAMRLPNFEAMDERVRLAVKRLGDSIGFGRMMQLAESEWRAKLEPQGEAGGEHTTGPCAALMVPCPCESRSNCDWCCGAGRVTKRVRQAMAHARNVDKQRRRLLAENCEIRAEQLEANAVWCRAMHLPEMANVDAARAAKLRTIAARLRGMG